MSSQCQELLRELQIMEENNFSMETLNVHCYRIVSTVFVEYLKKHGEKVSLLNNMCGLAVYVGKYHKGLIDYFDLIVRLENNRFNMEDLKPDVVIADVKRVQQLTRKLLELPDQSLEEQQPEIIAGRITDEEIDEKIDWEIDREDEPEDILEAIEERFDGLEGRIISLQSDLNTNNAQDKMKLDNLQLQSNAIIGHVLKHNESYDDIIALLNHIISLVKRN